jgi:hypothetical protein
MKYIESLENEVLKGKFGPKMVKIEGIRRKLYSAELYNL